MSPTYPHLFHLPPLIYPYSFSIHYILPVYIPYIPQLYPLNLPHLPEFKNSLLGYNSLTGFLAFGFVILSSKVHSVILLKLKFAPATLLFILFSNSTIPRELRLCSTVWPSPHCFSYHSLSDTSSSGNFENVVSDMHCPAFSSRAFTNTISCLQCASPFL